MPATWGKNTLTNQALTMMNQALGISAITFTKAVTITDDITGDSVSQLQALTSVNYKQSRTPKAIATQDNKSRLGVTIDNSDVNEDYIYYGVGLYAKQNSTNQEVLFSVIPLTAGATMIAKENNATTASIYLDLYTDIVRGTQVTIMVSNSGTLSREDVQQMISQSIGNALNYPNETASIGTDFNAILDISITRIINDTTVVNAPSGFSGTGYLTTIGSGDKTVPIMQTLDDTINNIRSTRYFNSTTNVWSEWNAYAKTIDVNQQLDKKVNVNDTVNWQKQKITADDGSVLVNVPSGDLSNVISNLTIGFYTLYCATAVINSPSIKALRGFIHITWYGSAGHNVGGGTLIDEDGIAYTVTAVQGVVAYKSLADDLKVAHLSGANNFETVPTVDKNPLLLANSLPSDLARTGQDTNFTGKLQKSGIDVATVNQLPVPDDSGWVAFPSNSNLYLNAYYKIFNGVLYTMGTAEPKNTNGTTEKILNVQSIISYRGYNSLSNDIQYHQNYQNSNGSEYYLDFNNSYSEEITVGFGAGVDDVIGINLTIPIHEK